MIAFLVGIASLNAQGKTEIDAGLLGLSGR